MSGYHTVSVCFLLSNFCLPLKTVDWMLDRHAWVLSANVIIPRFLTETKMVNPERMVHCMAHLLQSRNNVRKSVRTNMEVSWHTIEFNKSFESTSLLLFKFPIGSVSYNPSCGVLLSPCLNA